MTKADTADNSTRCSIEMSASRVARTVSFAASMAAWGVYAGAMGQAGVIVAGHGLQGRHTATTLRVRDGQRQVLNARAAASATGLRCAVQIDPAQLEAAHQLYLKLPSGSRDDAVAMQALIPNWQFDPKRPCLVR